MKYYRFFCLFLCALFMCACSNVSSNDHPVASTSSSNLHATDVTNPKGIFSMSDFSEITPGISTYDELKVIYGEYGQFSFASFERKAIITLPGANESEVTLLVKLPEWVVTSIECSSSQWTMTETLEKITVDSIDSAHELFKIMPNISSITELSGAFSWGIREFPENTPLSITIPIQNGNYGNVIIDQDGVVRSVDYYCENDAVKARQTYSMQDFADCIFSGVTFTQIREISQANGFWVRSETDSDNQQMLILPSVNGCEITFWGNLTDDCVQIETMNSKN